MYIKAMKIAFFYLLIFFMPVNMAAQTEADIIDLSQQLLYAARTGDSTIEIRSQLSAVKFDELVNQLKNDEERKAFWLNIYNAFTQTGLKENPHWYKNRNKFYKRKFITIAGEKFSLDQVEHGILRRSKVKLALGHLNKLFPSAREKKLRVDKLDYRIHFALNCGAKSCPPVAFYKTEQLDRQLELATTAYLKTEVLFNGKDNTLELPAIFSWFRGDFNGKKGILKMLRVRKFVPVEGKPAIKWKPYDWSLALQNYTSE